VFTAFLARSLFAGSAAPTADILVDHATVAIENTYRMFEEGQPFRKSVVMAVAGGGLTLVLAMWHHLRRRRDRLQIPYGVAIAGAGLWVLGAHFAP
ncbi:MAG: hypothetical protein ABW203_04265, partial [Novosphingobium sp.]